MYFKQIAFAGVNSIHLTQDSVHFWASANVTIDLRVSK